MKEEKAWLIGRVGRWVGWVGWVGGWVVYLAGHAVHLDEPLGRDERLDHFSSSLGDGDSLGVLFDLEEEVGGWVGG